jgi:PAS domain S-box-containing protein
VERHLDSVGEGLVPLLLARQLDTIHENLAALTAKNDDWIAVVLVDARGLQLYPLPGRPLRVPRADQRSRLVEREVALQGTPLGRLAVTVDLAPGLAFGARRSDEVRWLLAAVFAAMVAAGLVTLELSVVRPVRQLARAAGDLGRRGFDSELPRAGGDEVGTLVRTFAGMRHELRGFQGQLLREIEVRIAAEASLRDLNRSLEAREAFFRAVLLESPAITAVIGPERNFRFVSTSARTVLGWSEEELMRLSALDLVHPEDRPAVEAAFRHLVDGEEATVRVGCRIRRRDATYREMDLVASDLLGDPQVKGLVVNARDVSAEHLLQEQLLQAQKLESVGRLAGGIAHDFNNLLTVLLGSAELLHDDLAGGPAADRELVEEIQSAGERARALTRQLLAFARRQVVAPVPLDLGEVVRGSEKLLRRLIGESIELSISAEPGLWPVRCDPGYVEQVVMNLAVNARDAMPNGGRLSLETANLPGNAAEEGDRVRLVVRDTGVGMSAEVKARLFEPFFTTKPVGQGTGLGLATVYGIVAQSGGRISVSSEPGQGAAFELLFPRHVAGDPATAVAADPARGAERGSGTILLVEDDRAVRRTAARALRRAGYRVVEAGDAAAALEASADPALALDLLVVDVGLPRVKGTRVAEAIRRSRPQLPILLVSGHVEEDADRGEVAEAGARFLPKPFTPSALLERVRTLLAERDAARPVAAR